MRLLIVLVLIVAGVLVLGSYRGWFHITSESSAAKPTITVTVDKDKIQRDKNDAQKQVQELKQR